MCLVKPSTGIRISTQGLPRERVRQRYGYDGICQSGERELRSRENWGAGSRSVDCSSPFFFLSFSF